MTSSAPVRDRLLDALVKITAERGLDQVSIREVASEADVSIGSVQYYCRNKEEMLLMTFEHLTSQIMERIDGFDKTRGVEPLLRKVLLEFLPLDARRTTESRVYLAFAARAAVSPGLARVQQTQLGTYRTRCEMALRMAQERGEASSEMDPKLAAVAIIALVDGLMLQMLSDPAGVSRKQATAAVDAQLAYYLGGAS